MRGVQGQDLGFEEIAGIRAHGIKLEFPANPGDPDNLSTDHETESWVSQEWALTLQETYRRSKTNWLDCMRVLLLRAEEPDPTSFEIPPDYQTEIRPAHSSSRDGGYPPESPNR
jgi:hypothetical protein